MFRETSKSMKYKKAQFLRNNINFSLKKWDLLNISAVSPARRYDKKWVSMKHDKSNVPLSNLVLPFIRSSLIDMIFIFISSIHVWDDGEVWCGYYLQWAVIRCSNDWIGVIIRHSPGLISVPPITEQYITSAFTRKLLEIRVRHSRPSETERENANKKKPCISDPEGFACTTAS